MHKLILNLIGIVISSAIISADLFVAYLVKDLPSKYALTILMFSTLLAVISIAKLWEK